MMKYLIYLSLVLNLILSPLSSQTTSNEEFFQLQQTVKELQQEIEQLKRQIHEIEIKTSVPELKKEITRLVDLPELTHEIVLKNGTVIRGKLIYEDLDKLILETQIGQITIRKEEVKITRKAELPHARLEFIGPIDEKIFPDKRVYSGKIKNSGLRRADFPRVIFSLFSEDTRLIASDSSFVQGKYHVFSSGVITDATLEPGKTYSFQVEVTHPPDAKISYYTKTVHWNEFE